MENDRVILLVTGSLFILMGIGYVFVKTDSQARQKDEKRFGPLSNYGMGFGYIVLQNRLARILVSAIVIGLGMIFILAGFEVFD